MLNQNLKESRPPVAGNFFDNGVEELRVVDKVNGVSGKRKCSHNLFDHVQTFGFTGGGYSVCDDIESCIENSTRLLCSGFCQQKWETGKGYWEGKDLHHPQSKLGTLEQSSIVSDA